MSGRYARRNEKEIHTASSTPRPVCIASAGGNDYQMGIRDVEHPIGSVRHTRPECRPRRAVAETLERNDTTLLSDFMILSLSRNSLKAYACSWRRAVVDSTDWQVWSCWASGWLANIVPVCFSWYCNEDSKST